jgi:hypothetical protein
MRKYHDYEKIDLDSLTDLHVKITAEYKNVFFLIPFCPGYVCMCPLLAPEWLDEFNFSRRYQIF